MAVEFEDRVFESLAIRDTLTKTSSVTSSVGFITKSIIVENSLDQIVTLQLQGSRDEVFTKPINISSNFTIGANTNGYQTIADYFPFFRLTAVCAVAPTTGSLDVYFEKVK